MFMYTHAPWTWSSSTIYCAVFLLLLSSLSLQTSSERNYHEKLTTQKFSDNNTKSQECLEHNIVSVVISRIVNSSCIPVCHSKRQSLPTMCHKRRDICMYVKLQAINKFPGNLFVYVVEFGLDADDYIDETNRAVAASELANVAHVLNSDVSLLGCHCRNETYCSPTDLNNSGIDTNWKVIFTTTFCVISIAVFVISAGVIFALKHHSRKQLNRNNAINMRDIVLDIEHITYMRQCSITSTSSLLQCNSTDQIQELVSGIKANFHTSNQQSQETETGIHMQIPSRIHEFKSSEIYLDSAEVDEEFYHLSGQSQINKESMTNNIQPDNIHVHEIMIQVEDHFSKSYYIATQNIFENKENMLQQIWENNVTTVVVTTNTCNKLKDILHSELCEERWTPKFNIVWHKDHKLHQHYIQFSLEVTNLDRLLRRSMTLIVCTDGWDNEKDLPNNTETFGSFAQAVQKHFEDTAVNGQSLFINTSLSSASFVPVLMVAAGLVASTFQCDVLKLVYESRLHSKHVISKVEHYRLIYECLHNFAVGLTHKKL